MFKHKQRIVLIAIMLFVFQLMLPRLIAQPIPQSTLPIGCQVAVGVNDDVKFWNGTSWIAIPSGLPGQSLTFSQGTPNWITSPDGITTSIATNVSTTSATCGGKISSAGGSPVIARGVCWSTNPNPTLLNSFTTNDIGKGSFVSNLTGLTQGTTYYVKAYGTNSMGTSYGNEISFTTIIPVPAVTDYDGNTYDTVKIGTQTWMKQNLKVTHYRNGDAISLTSDNLYWSYLTTGAYSDYDNNPANSAVYGRLYNFYTILDTRQLCPTDYHVATNPEWTTLINYLGGTSLAGGKLKEIGTSHWFTPNTAATNSSGFTGLPGGYRSTAGAYVSLNGYSVWWEATLTPSLTGWFMSVDYYSNSVTTADFYELRKGASIRCIKD